jgi:D-alanine-D-alanine ligase
LNFPLIVKPATEDASMGIDLTSVVRSVNELYTRVEHVIRCYEQPAMVEEFIPGRELAVAVWGNDSLEVLPIAEEDYSKIPDPLQWLLTYESKWDPASPYYHNIVARCPALLLEAEEQCVHQTVIDTYQAMGLRDFGRVDIRFFDQIPFVIDINELPDPSPESGFWRSAKIGGYSYPEMIEKILTFALKREGWI